MTKRKSEPGDAVVAYIKTLKLPKGTTHATLMLYRPEGDLGMDGVLCYGRARSGAIPSKITRTSAPFAMVNVLISVWKAHPREAVITIVDRGSTVVVHQTVLSNRRGNAGTKVLAQRKFRPSAPIKWEGEWAA